MTFRLPYITPAKDPIKGRSVFSPVSLPLNVAPIASPFFQTDWPRVKGIYGSAPDQVHTDIGLFPNPIPVNNSNLLVPVSTVKLIVPDTQQVSRLLTTPFSPTDWSTVKFSAFPVVPNYTNIALTAVVVTVDPIKPYDWGKQQNIPDFPVPVQYRNLNISTVGSPVIPFDWGKQQQNPNFPPLPQYPNIALNVAPVFFPFYTQDFSKPFTPTPAKPDQSGVNINLYTNPIPFGPYDYSSRFVDRFTPVDQNGVPNLVLPNSSTPFVSYDWSKTKAVKASIDPQLPNVVILQPVGAPFSQLDWSKAYTITPRSSNQDDLPNLLLIQPSSPSTPLGLYGWIDWSRTQKPVIIVPDQNNLPNIVLPNTIPVPPVIIIGGSKWIKGMEAMLRRKAEQQTHSNTTAVRQAAAVLSKMGGIARAQALTKTQRSNIASNAAQARWKPKK